MRGKKAWIWDEINGDRESAKEVHCRVYDDSWHHWRAQELAEDYAESDADGCRDGLYPEVHGHPIMVEIEGYPPVRVLVTVEYTPCFRGVVDIGKKEVSS